MSKWLLKTFVKDYDDVTNSRVRTSYGVLASIVGIVCNIILFAIKLIIGLILGSVAVMADAFNNLSDAASSIIGFVGVRMADKPADEDHPFGHGRVEYISALIVAFLVIEVGISFFKSSIGKITNPQNIAFSLVSVIILAVSICIKLWLGFFNKKLGNRINSSVMKATATDAFGDVITTAVTIVSIFVAEFTSLNIDGYVGILVSLIVIWAGIGIARDTLAPLIGEAVDPELYEEIVKKVEGYEGIVGTHDLIVHNYGPGRSMASVHAEVPADVDLLKAHELIDRIEADVRNELGIFMVIHMDPIETKNEAVSRYKAMVKEVITSIDSALEIHDFRIVDGEEQVNLIFDVVVPYSYDKKAEAELRENICVKVKEKNSKCQCVMVLERGYRGVKKQ